MSDSEDEGTFESADEGSEDELQLGSGEAISKQLTSNVTDAANSMDGSANKTDSNEDDAEGQDSDDDGLAVKQEAVICDDPKNTSVDSGHGTHVGTKRETDSNAQSGECNSQDNKAKDEKETLNDVQSVTEADEEVAKATALLEESLHVGEASKSHDTPPTDQSADVGSEKNTDSSAKNSSNNKHHVTNKKNVGSLQKPTRGDSAPVLRSPPKAPKAHEISDEDRSVAAADIPEELRAAAALDRLTQKQENSGWGWSSWGSSILSTATSSVSTFTNSVGEGLSSVLGSVESTMGAPSPEELVEMQKARRLKEPQEGSNGTHPLDHQSSSDDADDDIDEDLIPQVSPSHRRAERDNQQQHEDPHHQAHESQWQEEGEDGWFKSWDAGITGISKTLVTGGLDVLETIGKKTYDVLAEGDGGIKDQIHKRRAKPNLSQVLREAAKEAEDAQTSTDATAESPETRQAHFGTLFDEYNGLVHLETLESVSQQCEVKVESLLASIAEEKLASLREDLLQITALFKSAGDEIEDEDAGETKQQQFVELLTEHMKSVSLSVDTERLFQVHKEMSDWLTECTTEQDAGTVREAQDIHYKAIESLAQLTVCSVELFHKIAQLIQLDPTTSVASYITKTSHIAGTLSVLCTEVDIVTSRFTDCLNTASDDSEDPDSITPLITNVYLESTNSKSYTQDAFQLLLPVLQATALQAIDQP